MLTLSKSLILGVDPGIKGALSWYNPDKRRVIETVQLPISPNRAGKARLNLNSIALTVSRMAPRTKFAVVEDVHSMPGQGVASMFAFGQALGQLEGLIAAYFIPIHKVSPATWKSVLHLSKDKKESRTMAAALFPEHAAAFSRAKDDGVAEATLLAVYGGLYFDDAAEPALTPISLPDSSLSVVKSS